MRGMWGKWYAFFAKFGFTRSEFVFLHLLAIGTFAGAMLKLLRSPAAVPVGEALSPAEFRALAVSDSAVADSQIVGVREWEMRSRLIAKLGAQGLQDSMRQALTSYDDAPVVQVPINTAGAEELASLPRIGPKLAGRIIEHRERHGKFRTAEDLLQVKGIGRKMLETIKPYITL